MGIRLDWEIEAERERFQQSGGEDPESKRKRRRAQLRFLLLLFVLLALVGGAVAAVVYRLHQVDASAEQVLRDTVAAEVAALRVGDKQSFLNLQRSATDDWIQEQTATFNHYQTLKQTDNINLSGNIVDVNIDNTRARVQVEEIIDGVPYGRIWFYWHYQDGWEHVPPDYTFWGEARTANSNGVQVNYEAVDEPVAQAMAQQVAQWLQTGCSMMGCSNLPKVTINIVPDPTQDVAWSADDQWTMLVPSPYITGARLDTPFDSGLQVKVANLIAARLLGDFNPIYPTDAYYLRQAIISWLVQQFAQVETNSFLISSLAQNYGNSAVGQLLQAMQPGSDASVINQITGTTLDAAKLDWRDFLTWRLNLENQLITRQDQSDYLALYDTNDPAVHSAADARYSAGASSDPLNVISAIPGQASDGTPQLQAVVQVGSPTKSQETVTFRLINGNWKRVS